MIMFVAAKIRLTFLFMIFVEPLSAEFKGLAKG